MAYGYRNLSPKMEETLRIMIKHRKLIRYDGGFWSWEGCKMEHGINFDCPMWYCLVNTLRALHKRGAIVLDEVKQEAIINETDI